MDRLDTEAAEFDLERVRRVVERCEAAVVVVCTWACALFVLFFTYLFVASASGLGL